MPVTLQPIDKDNWRQAIKLKLTEDQKGFVAPNWYSIIECLYEDSPYAYSMAIMADDVMVGYSLFGYFSDDPPGECWIGRLMIDSDHQGKGYGRAALMAILAHLKAANQCGQIFLSVEPENTIARALYESAGFVSTGRIEHDELVYEYTGDQG
ncbi:MAG: GNAT family N-acetyltransferase [Chloroflexota bacterium]